MSSKKFRIGIAVIGIFFIGFYHKPIGDYFNTINTIIGLLSSIIIILLFCWNKEYHDKIMNRNSYTYLDGQNTIINRQFENLNNIIKEKDGLNANQRIEIAKLNNKIIVILENQ